MEVRMSQEPNFDCKDVWKVARALLGNSINYDVTHGMNAYNECIFCNGNVYHDKNPDKILHEINCPVKIAHDLLVGAEDETV